MGGAAGSAVEGIVKLVIIVQTRVRIVIVVVHVIAGLLTNFSGRHSWYGYPKDLPLLTGKVTRALGSKTNTCVLSDTEPQEVWWGRKIAVDGFLGGTRSLD